MQEEVYGSRDRSYSAWHRRLSTQRFVGIETAQTLAMIDLDASLYVEYDDGTKQPLALIETARDVGQSYKTATVTTNLSKCCTARPVPAFALLYTLASRKNPCDPNWYDIDAFRAKRLWPKPELDFRPYTPAEWAMFLVRLRQKSATYVDEELNKQRDNEASTNGYSDRAATDPTPEELKDPEYYGGKQSLLNFDADGNYL